jgi:hypothetical protein
MSLLLMLTIHFPSLPRLFALHLEYRLRVDRMKSCLMNRNRGVGRLLRLLLLLVLGISFLLDPCLPRGGGGIGGGGDLPDSLRIRPEGVRESKGIVDSVSFNLGLSCPLPVPL